MPPITTELHICIHIEAREQYLLAIEQYRLASVLAPDDPTCNSRWAYTQLKVHPDIKFSRQRIPDPDTPYMNLINNTTMNATVECYLPIDRLDLSTFRHPGLYVTVLPRPRGWPVRPEGGFTDNTQGFVNSANDDDYSE